MAAHVALVFAEGYRAFRRIVRRRAPPPHKGATQPVRAGSVGPRTAALPAGPPVDPYLVRRLAGAPREMLVCLYYDEAGAFRAERIWQGCLRQVVAGRGEVLRGALDHAARYLVIAHNHPSGALRPSAQDIEATRQLHRMCVSVGVVLVDHAIVARGGKALSFRELGLL